MKSLKKIIAVCLVFVTLFCVIPVTALADGEGHTYMGDSFWGWVLRTDLPDWLNDVVGFVSSDFCEDSPNHMHTANSYIRKTNFLETVGSLGVYDYECRCQYCGSLFYVNERNVAEIFQDNYDQFSGKTPTTGGSSSGTFGGRIWPVGVIKNDGKLIWKPEIPVIRYFTDGLYAFDGSSTTYYGGGGSYVFTSSPSSDSNVLLLSYHSNSLVSFGGFKTTDSSSFSFSAPLKGLYNFIQENDYVITTYNDSSLVSHTYTAPLCFISNQKFVNFSSVSSSRLYDASESVLSKLSLYIPTSSSIPSSFPPSLEFFDINFEIHFNSYFEITPYTGLVDIQHDETFSPDTRAATFTGDIGIIGDNGQLTKVEGDQIFNETTNNYYNPSTGETTTVTDWFYDYSDRSYHLTTQEGDTVTVTYGDENITIVEGDTTYNVYYIIEVEGGDCTDGLPHSWSVTETVPATCTMAGSETQTCSKCGQTKTIELPAIGHKWKVKQSVQTKYDEAGQLLQEGYTIYVCERCGEEYKDTASTGPPPVDPGGGGDSGGSSGDADTSFWDDVVDFFKSIADSFTSLPEWFSRFSEFLSSAFSYLPNEIVLLLTFGVFAVVGIGIWKAVRR